MAVKLSRPRTRRHTEKFSITVAENSEVYARQRPVLVVQAVETPHYKPSNAISTKTRVDIGALVNIKLPPLPNAAVRVAELCRSNSPAYTVADAIGYDPALTARILRAANSPLYSTERDVTTLITAVNVLGLRSLHQLTISYAASSLFEGSRSPSTEEHTMWRHAVFVAVASRTITATFSPDKSEEAFLCGLLHDVGKILMLQHDKRRYEPLLEISDEDQLLEAERKTFGFTHPQVSARVVYHWGLGDDIVDAILYHHSPDEALHSLLVTRALCAADKLSKASDYGLIQISDAELDADESVFLLGLSAERRAEIRQHVEQNMTEMMSLLAR